MTATAGGPRNPFATRHTRPGRLVPRDAAGVPLDLEAVAARALTLGVAAIEGPHGSGKTNLLAALAKHLGADGRPVEAIRVRSARDGLRALGCIRRSGPGATVCVDGWEALGRTWAALVRWSASRRGVGLIVTCHRALGLPTLVRCTTSPALLARLVADLPAHEGLIGGSDIAAAFAARRGDVREALYDLYDRFERRARRG